MANTAKNKWLLPLLLTPVAILVLIIAIAIYVFTRPMPQMPANWKLIKTGMTYKQVKAVVPGLSLDLSMGPIRAEYDSMTTKVVWGEHKWTLVVHFGEDDRVFRVVAWPSNDWNYNPHSKNEQYELVP